MWRNKAKRGPVATMLMAIGIGYIVGAWQTTALRTTDPSAAETVALRFPEDWEDISSAPVEPDDAPAVNSIDSLVLFNPAPMGPRLAPQAAPRPAQQPTMQTAAWEEASRSPAPNANASRPAAVAAPVPAPGAVKATADAKVGAEAAARRRASRPGYLLDDAQIAAIKQRLHLRPDQEQMWPAVEAALRNVAYARAREERRRGNPGTVQTAATIDPDSAEVQGLKSAAVPLIMSFDAEQKDEVRNLAHVMGLDQLARQF